MRTILFVFGIHFILTGCSFNDVFLKPDRMRPDLDKLIVHSGSDTILITFTGANHQPLFTRNGNDTMNKQYRIDACSFKSRSGNLLNGWMIKPASNQVSSTILHFHGNAGWLLSQFGAILPLVKHNFQVFIFDYSGFGFSEGNASRSNVLKDALSAIEYVTSRQDVKGHKLVFYGQSLGGHLSAVVAGIAPTKPDALVIEGAFSSHKDVAGFTTQQAIGMRFVGSLLVSEMYSGKEQIRKYQGPVLVIHSSEDDVVDWSLGKKLFDAANQPKEFLAIKHCHICGPKYYETEIAEKITNMIKE